MDLGKRGAGGGGGGGVESRSLRILPIATQPKSTQATHIKTIPTCPH